MGLFDRDKDEKKKKADFSNVESGSSATAPKTEEAKTEKYTVQSGDSLWAISERFYGNGNEWHKIYEANRGQIKDPDVIQPGWELNIPSRADVEGEVK
jgi:nucleoid-associated protein YgaU